MYACSVLVISLKMCKTSFWLNVFLSLFLKLSSLSPGPLSKTRDNQRFIAAGSLHRKQMLFWLKAHTLIHTHACIRGCAKWVASRPDRSWEPSLSPELWYLLSMCCRGNKVPGDRSAFYFVGACLGFVEWQWQKERKTRPRKCSMCCFSLLLWLRRGPPLFAIM